MARGITENDVFTACDALLLAGERPTIERVRQKMGRGSPNTVSPMLDAWFKGLGRRLQDPGAFAVPPDCPEPVLQAAEHFWEVAQASARADVEARIAERLAPMERELEAAVQARDVALAAREASALDTRAAKAELVQTAARLDEERLAHAATAARTKASQEQVERLQARLESAEAQAQEVDARARTEIRAAQERADGAERRAALEIEAARATRVKAEKHADSLERRNEALQATAASHLEEATRLRASLSHAKQEIERLGLTEVSLRQLLANAESSLQSARVEIGRIESEAQANRLALTQVLNRLPERKPQKSGSRVK